VSIGQRHPRKVFDDPQSLAGSINGGVQDSINVKRAVGRIGIWSCHAGMSFWQTETNRFRLNGKAESGEFPSSPMLVRQLAMAGGIDRGIRF